MLKNIFHSTIVIIRIRISIVKMPFFYAVKIGKIPGVYTSWEECKDLVNGYPNSQCKKFKSKEEAEAFVDYKIIPQTKIETLKMPCCRMPDFVPLGKVVNAPKGSLSTLKLKDQINSKYTISGKKLTTEIKPLSNFSTIKKCPKKDLERFRHTSQASSTISVTPPTSGASTVQIEPNLKTDIVDLTKEMGDIDIEVFSQTNEELFGSTNSNDYNSNNLSSTHFPKKKPTPANVRHTEFLNPLSNQFQSQSSNDEKQCPTCHCTWPKTIPELNESQKAQILAVINDPTLAPKSKSTSTSKKKKSLTVESTEKRALKNKLTQKRKFVAERNVLETTLKRQKTGAVEVYTDGACENNGRINAKAGIGVWWGNNDPRNISEPLLGRQTNNRAEIHAAIRALRQAKEDGNKNVILYTDSQFLMKSITLWIDGWKRNNWTLSSGLPVVNKDDFEELDEVCQGLNVDWKYVKAHSGIFGNVQADKLAVEGRNKK